MYLNGIGLTRASPGRSKDYKTIKTNKAMIARRSFCPSSEEWVESRKRMGWKRRDNTHQIRCNSCLWVLRWGVSGIFLPSLEGIPRPAMVGV